MDDNDRPLKDYGSFTHQPVGDDDIASHHTERWQHQAMYVGLHFPQHAKKRHHRKHHGHRRDKDKNNKSATDEKPEDDEDLDKKGSVCMLFCCSYRPFLTILLMVTDSVNCENNFKILVVDIYFFVTN